MSWFLAGVLVSIGLGAGLVIGLIILLWVRRKHIPTMMTSDGRRVWAFMAILGGCLIFTVFAATGVWLVRKSELYSLILALAAHLQILVGLSAFGFLLGRRVTVSGGREGIKISDGDDEEPHTPAEGAQVATDAAQQVADKLAEGEAA